MPVPFFFGQQGTAWSPLSLGSTLKIWFDTASLAGLANADPISSWSDSSGNSHTATQSGSTRPTYNTSAINSKPSGAFSGTQYLNVASPVALTGDFTVFAVVNRLTSTQMWITGSASGYLGIYSGDNKLYFANDSGSASSVAYTVNGDAILQIKRSSNVVSVRNAKGGAWTTVGTKSGTLTTTYYGHTGFGGFSSACKHGDLLICDTVLGSGDDDSAWDYLKTKYGL